VLRALRKLVEEGKLIRLGYGIYGRAIISRLSRKPILYSPDGFIGAARQALTKLGVKWELTEWERSYNEGRSTQVPVNPIIRIKGRFSRRLRDGSQELVLELCRVTRHRRLRRQALDELSQLDQKLGLS